MKRASAVLLALVLAACEVGGVGGRSAADSIASLNTQLQQAQATTAQQDSLLTEFKATTELVGQIDSVLSKVRGLKTTVPLSVTGRDSTADPRAAYRATLLKKLEEVTRLLAANRRRVNQLAAENKTQGGKIAEYEQTIASLEGLVANQKVQIEALSAQIDSLSQANTQLAAANAATHDTVNTLRRANNTVYYVVGSKKDLMERGIVVEEGSKFLFFGHKALVPARTLDPSAFTSIDKTTSLDIPLPPANGKYRIVSRQDPSLVEIQQENDSAQSGSLHITSPDQFWAPSKFLIVVTG
ncbi:MAG TPA: hypothetical protein VFK13_04395 [Gemmatimonadaceae bacterium]|nr:hypothetical protein [Gemmatimonadaceae bacterium]